uniref:Uncharacterized protein n=1 Tax=Anguilla anguilla TaxID=7936 RepID=A0A0E9PA29_ANGAN
MHLHCNKQCKVQYVCVSTLQNGEMRKPVQIKTFHKRLSP